MFRRAVSLLCMIALLFAVPAVAQGAGTFQMAGFDGDNSNHVWENNAFFTRMQERTGVAFTFDQYTDYTKWQDAKKTMFETGALPDVLFKAELSTREQITYAASGQLIDLKPLLAENAPNLWALLQENPEWLQAITLPDGKIVALPAINRLSSQNAMWINSNWLDALKLDMPTDWDSLVAVLTAFKTGDPNANGKADEIPLTFLGPWDLKFLAHAFGLVANDYNIALDAQGQVRFVPETQEYKAFLEAVTSLYASGVMDTNGFFTSDSLRTVTDAEAPLTYGMFFGPNPMNLLPYEAGAQYQVLMPLQYQGKQVYRDLYGAIVRGTFAITSACTDPAALLRWVDVLYSEEGAIEALAGKVGDDYTVSEDGKWSYAGDLDSISSYILYDMSIYDTGNMPWLFPLDFYGKYENDSISRVNAQMLTLQSYIIKPFPAYTLTPEQEDAIAPVQAELGRFVDESMGKFVLGEWDITDPAAWQEYLQGLDEHGKPELINFWQEIADSLTD